jgi:hypothetical protein
MFYAVPAYKAVDEPPGPGAKAFPAEGRGAQTTLKLRGLVLLVNMQKRVCFIQIRLYPAMIAITAKFKGPSFEQRPTNNQ